MLTSCALPRIRLLFTRLLFAPTFGRGEVSTCTVDPSASGPSTHRSTRADVDPKSFHAVSGSSPAGGKPTLPVRFMNSIKGTLVVISLALAATSANARTWYVEHGAPGKSNGTSWTDAWHLLTDINGVQPGDTVLISGGNAAVAPGYHTNPAPTTWSPPSGIAGNPITYRIGQDKAHSSNARFSVGAHPWLGYLHDVVISGDAGDGKNHFTLDPGTTALSVGVLPSSVKIDHVDTSALPTNNNPPSGSTTWDVGPYQS